MVLTEQQTDALTELINIAFARTGAALSELTGHRVLLRAANRCAAFDQRIGC